MRNRQKLLFFVLLAFVFITEAGFVLATNTAGQDLSNGAANLFKWALGIAGLLSALTIAFGGAYYLFSFSRGSFKTEAQEWIKAGLTGLLITMCSWLIAYTINPNLVIFDVSQLTPQQLFSTSAGGPSPFNPIIVNYDEIPMGMLTENLIAGKMDCYDFDQDGNPIAGGGIEDDSKNSFLGPTLRNHDRVDCFLKLSDAISKKSLAVEQLSKEILKLLSKCSCKDFGHCDDCNTKNGVTVPETSPESPEDQCRASSPNCPSSGSCSGLCTTDVACHWVKDPVLTPNSGNSEPKLSCCDPADRDKIKGYIKNHGDKKAEPFKFAITQECDGNCSDKAIYDYYGLDEFYTELLPAEIKNKIEKTTQVGGSNLTYIDLDSCPTCISNCNCDQGDTACQSKQPKCIADQEKCMTDERPKCLAEKTPWGKLNLAEQLMYLNEKLNEIKTAVKNDLTSINSGAEKLSGCSMTKPYIDLRQTDETTDSEFVLLNIKPMQTTSENIEDQKNIDISKYCNGFNYNNSQCYSACTEACPITESKATDCFGGCGVCDQSKLSPEDYQTCISKQKTCVEDCYNNRECTLRDGKGTFKKCITDCRGNCISACQVKYIDCSHEFATCHTLCENDSSCLLGNYSTTGSSSTSGANITSCLLGANDIANCKNSTTEEEMKKCVETAYTCKSGSSQFSGYPECLTSPATRDDYTSSFIYLNPDSQVCPVALGQKSNNWTWSFWPTGKGCIEVYPETAKCPSASQCPECKCDSTAGPGYFLMEDPLTPPARSSCGNVNSDPFDLGGECQQKYEGFPVIFRDVGPECNQPAYNDDPMTFYCRQDWWNEPDTKRIDAVGQTKTCSKAKEIPIGVTVDDAIKWTNDFLKIADKASDASQKMLDALNKISTRDDYCECDSKYEGGSPICRTCCNFNSPTCGEDDQGRIITITKAWCSFTPCAGNSCQQLIEYLYKIINSRLAIKSGFVELWRFVMPDQRTDVLKELTYSRQEINQCSADQNITGTGNIRMFSCQRVLDDIIPPIVESDKNIIFNKKTIPHYCYGTLVGTMFEKKIATNNWFCCETTKEKSTYEEDISNAHKDGAGGGYSF